MSVEKLLAYVGAENYAPACCNRIRFAGLVDEAHIMHANPSEKNLHMDLQGIQKCREILNGYMEPERFQQIYEYFESSDNVTRALNNILFYLRNSSKKALRKMYCEASETEALKGKCYSPDIILEELKSRRLFRKEYLEIKMILKTCFATIWYYHQFKGLPSLVNEEIRQKAKDENKPDGLKELLYVHFTQEDNLSLSEEVKARYRNNYSGVFYKRYILGLWAMAEGIIYDMFDVDRHVKKVVDFARLLIDGGRYVSIDYGTQNAMVFLLWNKGIDKKWYCTREYYYSGRDKGKQKADSQYADDLEKWLEGTPVKAIIVDPSAASFITELNNRGYKTMKADNDVEDGIRLVSTLLNTEKIAFSQSCINTIKEFASYIWDPKAADRGEDKPIKQHDHAMDAVRYFCYTILNNKTIKIRSKSAYGFN
ncbi:MAG: PBSX family phage terminase large subunit [Hungatella sp.]|nr:PBSX family phage terminase large subunit [Hungatella sp.]